MKKFYILYFIFFSILISQGKEEILKIEKEDAIMEITVKEKQREIEEEKRTILEEEAQYLKVGSSKKNYYYDFFFPGLGHFFRGNYWKSFGFGMSFWFGVVTTNYHYQKAKHLSETIERESIYNPFASFYLLPKYRYHNTQSEIFTIATVGLYILNLFISFNDENKLEVSLIQKKESSNSLVYEIKFSLFY